MATFPYAEISNIFNPSDYGTTGDTLTITEGDLRYIRQGGPANVSSLMINSAPVDFSAISGVVAGTATNNKALILGPSGEIGTISSLTATSITGTLSTAAQTAITSVGTLSALTIGGNLTFTGASRTITGLSSISATTLTGALSTGAQTSITSLGTLTSLSIDGNLTFTGASRTITGLATLSATTLTGTLSTAAQTAITSVGTLSALTIGGNLTFTGASRTITGLSSISATTLTGALSTAAQTAITSVGTLTNLTLSTAGTGLQIPNLKFWNSTTSLYDNFNHSYYIGVSEGGCVAQKALIVDINKDIGSIRTLNAVNLNGSTKVSGTLADFGSIRVDGTEIITATRSIQNIGDIACSGTMNAFDGYQVNSVAFVDASRNITAGTISGTLTTGAQPAITAIGPLMTPTAGDTLITSSTISEYNLILGNASNAAVDSGIAFYSNASPDFTTNRPGASIVAEKVSTTIGGSGMDIVFLNKTSSQNATANLTERMRIKENGKINFGSAGDADFNMLRSGQLDTTLRFGADLSVRDCYSITFHRDSAGALTNYLAFNNYGTSNTLVLTARDRVGIGTNDPACGLDVVNFASVSMTGPLATGTSSAYTVNRSGTFTDSVSIYCRQALMVGVRGMYVGSDRRVKEDIDSIPPADGVRFVRNIDPKIYTLKGFDKRQIGYISQDMMQDYSALISLIPDENMTIEEEGDVDGAFLSLSYERVPAFLHAALKSVFDRLDAQDVIIEELRASLATLL